VLFINDITGCLIKRQQDIPKIRNREIQVLMYADDLVVLANSKEELQRPLHNLDNYCNLIKLAVNIRKHK